MNEKQRDALARRIEQDIQTSRKNGTTARDLYMPNAAGVARALTFVLGENYSFHEFESALGKEMHAFPSVLLEKNWEVSANAGRSPEVTKEDMRSWSPEKRLAYANQQTLERIEKTETETRQKEVTDNNFDTATPGSAAQRLAIANSWRAVGVDLDAPKNSAPTREQLAKDVGLRLSVANEEALRKSKGSKP